MFNFSIYIPRVSGKSISIVLSGFETQSIRYLSLIPIFQGKLDPTPLETKDILEGMIGYTSEKVSLSKCDRIKFLNSLLEKKNLPPIELKVEEEGHYDAIIRREEERLRNSRTSSIIDDYLKRYGSKINVFRNGNYILRLSDEGSRSLETLYKITSDVSKELRKKVKDTDYVKECLNFVLRDFMHYWEFTEFAYLGTLFGINIVYAEKIFLNSKAEPRKCDSVPRLFKLNEFYLDRFPDHVKNAVNSIRSEKDTISTFREILKKNDKPKSFSGYLEFFKYLQSPNFPFNYFTASLGLILMIQSREFLFFDFAILAGMIMELGFDNIGASSMDGFLHNIEVLMREDPLSQLSKKLTE